MVDRQNGSGVSVALLVLPAASAEAGAPPARAIPLVMLVMRASVVGADVSRLYVEVSGPDVDEPVAAELPVKNGGGESVTVTVPAGPQRVFALRAVAGGGGSYAGSAAADVCDGTAALLTVALLPNGAGHR